MDQGDRGEGFSVLDGVALVMGSAIASVHGVRVMNHDLTVLGWVMLGAAFSFVALTATGPFLFLARRFARRLPDYPKVGDRLWAVLGLPWLAAAVVQSAVWERGSRQNSSFTLTLSVGLVLACAIAMSVVWSTWVMVSPEQAAVVEARPWTNRIGLILAVAWPIQCGLGMVVLN